MKLLGYADKGNKIVEMSEYEFRSLQMLACAFNGESADRAVHTPDISVGDSITGFAELVANITRIKFGTNSLRDEIDRFEASTPGVQCTPKT